ncbi:LamG domain-containing protein [Ornithinicoccus halotolerans]|uniref:hypothetical protein n=1 Tax=Ornithinicoccus halotolerans TaxID=1748220 RepID=UPI00188649B8|nr:hypothetical protein [Ornithinicoccus halotolerans]
MCALVSAASTLVPLPAQAERPPVDVVLDLRPPADAASGQTVDTLEQHGTARVDVSVGTLDGGSAQWADHPVGGLVVDFPQPTSDVLVPRAVLAVRDLGAPDGTQGGDAFSPGRRSFSFGADFRPSLLQRGRYDDGDNVIQRGLASDASQYKLEISGGRVACYVTGSRGTLGIHVGDSVDPRAWYTARCSRLGEAIVLWVAEHRPDGSVQAQSRTRHGLLGEVAWDSDGPPVAIGGKLGATGELVRSATDQLNGHAGRPVIVLDSTLALECEWSACPYAVAL